MPRFVIQQHHATSMHWDFRLEVDGTFKSWAVPKGPSMRPRDKRLAMAVDDHSIGWGDFEGTIGEGEYGAGPVIVWDRGSYQNLRDESMQEALAAGHASFWLEGEKLHGGWSLRRTDGRRWLLVKRRDEHADSGDPVATRPESVLSGRTIEGVREGTPPHGVKKGTRDQLYNEARKLNIEGRSSMNKSQLQRAVDAKR
jgi:DNA ligase D-like protein (predicted 3'-phosphoesterase)